MWGHTMPRQSLDSHSPMRLQLLGGAAACSAPAPVIGHGVGAVLWLIGVSGSMGTILRSIRVQQADYCAHVHRKRLLLRHLHATRQRLLRLHVVTAWSSKANAMANVARVLDVCGRHTDALRDAADQLAYLHAELGGLQACARATAVDICTRTSRGSSLATRYH